MFEDDHIDLPLELQAIVEDWVLGEFSDAAAKEKLVELVADWNHYQLNRGEQ